MNFFGSLETNQRLSATQEVLIREIYRNPSKNSEFVASHFACFLVISSAVALKITFYILGNTGEKRQASFAHCSYLI